MRFVLVFCTILGINQLVLSDCCPSCINTISHSGNSVVQETSEKIPTFCADFFAANNIKQTCCKEDSLAQIYSAIGKERFEAMEDAVKAQNSGDRITKIKALWTTIEGLMTQQRTVASFIQTVGQQTYDALIEVYDVVKDWIDKDLLELNNAQSLEDSETFQTCKKTLNSYYVGTACLRCSNKATDFIDTSGRYLLKKDVCSKLVKDCATLWFFRAGVDAMVVVLRRIVSLYLRQGDKTDISALSVADLNSLKNCIQNVETCSEDNNLLNSLCEFANVMAPTDQVSKPPTEIVELANINLASRGRILSSFKNLILSEARSRVLSTSAQGTPVISDDGASGVFGASTANGEVNTQNQSEDPNQTKSSARLAILLAVMLFMVKVFF